MKLERLGSKIPPLTGKAKSSKWSKRSRGKSSDERKPFKPPFEMTERKTKTINVKYKECMCNHATQLGVNVVDGCGEFAPKGRSETRRIVDLDCEACGCHRHFHRKEVTRKISLTFIEKEEANLFRFHPRPP
ncbi:mini zinc finger protein 1-like [Durio zibethinus]|uniref:Mini zinc finger protein 1-like n=1 Tax=Durio zibethinus TaxID=66656 RepID=A0A6P5WVL0_DURZI|nr:mini zinc finger protein 1-like [Durio zibethinus]